MANEGFISLGEALVGGNPLAGETAYLQGLDTGSKISARRASTVNALQQARTRRNEAEAQERLRDSAESLAKSLDIDPSIVDAALAGLNPEQLTGAAGDVQIGGFRNQLADPALGLTERQALSNAIEGKVVDPLQIEGGLTADVFGPEAGVPRLAPVSEADRAATEALAAQRNAAAALSTEKREHPERFRSGGITLNLNGKGLGSEVLDDIGDTLLPEDLNPREATGVTGALQSAANIPFDIANADLPFPETSVAENALNDLATQMTIVGAQSVPGRPNVTLLQLFENLGVRPNNITKGDQRTVDRLRQSSTFLAGEIERTRRQLDFSADRMTKNKLAEFEEGLRAMAGLKRDIDYVVGRFDATDPNKASDNTTERGGSYEVIEDE